MKNHLFGLVLLTLVIATCCEKPQNDTCEDTYMEESGVIRFSTGPSPTVLPKVKCTWYIHSNSSDPKLDPTIFLVWDNILLHPEDAIVIMSNGSKLESFVNPFKDFLVPGAFSFLTGKSNITVTLVTVDKPGNRVFQMHYYRNSVCNHNFTTAPSGIFQTPIYDHSTYPMPVQCDFKVAVQGKDENYLSLSLEQFIFHQGSVTINGSEEFDQTFDGNNFPAVEFMSKKTIDISLIINNASTGPHIFKVNYASVSAKCSGILKLSSTEVEQHLQTPAIDVIQALIMDSTGSDHRKMNCQWLVACDEGQVLSAQLNNVTLAHPMDQLLILDGPNKSCPALLDLNSFYKDDYKDKIIYSSGNYLWISASTLFLSTNFTIDILVSKKSGGYKWGNGEILAKDSSTYLLEVDPGKQVKVMFSQPGSVLGSSSHISFYSDFTSSAKPFATLTSGQKLPEFVVSPTEKMLVNITSTSLNASFEATELGCYEYASGSEDTFSVTGNCNNTCAWTINPKPVMQAFFAFHFSELSLSGDDLVMIRKMDAAQTSVANLSAPTSFMPDLWLPASEGVFIQVNRKNCNLNNTILKASYSFVESCQVTFEPKLGEAVELASPNHPNYYPLGANCTMTVKRPTGSAFLHVTLKDLHLASPADSLILYALNGSQQIELASFNNTSDMPNDYPVMSDLVVTFVSDLKTPFKSNTGFSLSVAVVEKGFITTNASGVIQSPDYPKPVESGSLFAWIIQLPSTDLQQNILNYSFPSNTNFTVLDANLKLYDGLTLRSPVVSENGTHALSRTNSLIVLYQRTNLTIPGANFSITFESHACNMSFLCNSSKICMHDDWHCNGINDCGDYSDEQNCEGYYPPGPTPAPAPGPTPAPAPAVKGVSTAALAVGILMALLIGALLGVGAPAAYRRIRGNQFRNYSSFTNNIE